MLLNRWGRKSGVSRMASTTAFDSKQAKQNKNKKNFFVCLSATHCRFTQATLSNDPLYSFASLFNACFTSSVHLESGLKLFICDNKKRKIQDGTHTHKIPPLNITPSHLIFFVPLLDNMPERTHCDCRALLNCVAQRSRMPRHTFLSISQVG